MDQEERIGQAYGQLKNSTEHDYQRVVYETPAGDGWMDSTGYIAEVNVSGEPAIKVVSEDEVETIPFNRVFRVHTVSEE